MIDQPKDVTSLINDLATTPPPLPGVEQKIDTSAPKLESSEEPTVDPNKIIFEHEDQRWELPLNAKAKFKAKTGKEEEATLEDLKHELYGRREWDRRFNDLGQKAQFAQEWENFAQHFADKSKSGAERMAQALTTLISKHPELQGDWKEFTQAYAAYANQLAQMSPEERAAAEKEHHLKQKTSQQTQEMQAVIAAQQEQLNEVRLKQLQTKYQLDDDTTNMVLNASKTYIQQQNLKLDEAGVWNVIGQIADTAYAQNYGKRLLKEVDPALESNSDALEELISFRSRHKDATDDQIKSRIQKLYGSSTQATGIGGGFQGKARLPGASRQPSNQNITEFIQESTKAYNGDPLSILKQTTGKDIMI